MAQHRSWYDFLMDALIEGGVMKRLDLAINDMAGILDIPELTEKCNHEECISVFRSFKSYRSGELVRSQEQDKYGMGNTLYVGSLKSEVYFCIYEKDYEQYAKYDIAIEDTKIKNRFEIRLKNERAYYAVRDLLTYHDAERTAFDIINRYMRFADKEVDKRRSEWKTNEKWAYLSVLIVGVETDDQTRTVHARKDAELDKQTGSSHMESLTADRQYQRYDLPQRYFRPCEAHRAS